MNPSYLSPWILEVLDDHLYEKKCVQKFILKKKKINQTTNKQKTHGYCTYVYLNIQQSTKLLIALSISTVLEY